MNPATAFFVVIGALVVIATIATMAIRHFLKKTEEIVEQVEEEKRDD